MPPFSSFLIFSFLCFHHSSIQGSFDSSSFIYITSVRMINKLFFALTSLVILFVLYIHIGFYTIVLIREDFPRPALYKRIQDMGYRLLQFLTVFLLHLFLCSGSSVTEKPPPEEINPKRKQNNQEFRILLAPSTSTITILDNIPIVNPTPGTTNPSPTSPSTEPITNPTTPPTTPAAPFTTPTTPFTTPTAPPTTPTTPPTTPTTPTTTPTTPTTGGTWCVANQGASPTALQVALDYACGYGGADCSAIQSGGSCYDPNTVHDHASYAFNDYYQKHPGPTSCVFGGTAQLTNADPSSGNCHYAASSGTSVTPPASITPPASLTPPATATMSPPFAMGPPTFTVPGGEYGSAEPTGLPSSATSVSFSFSLIFATIGLAWSLVSANKF